MNPTLRTSHRGRASIGQHTPVSHHHHASSARPVPPVHSLAQESSVRQAKDPKKFKDMEELRRHLEVSEGQSPGFISSAINFFSSASFGAAGLEQPWWSPARLYRQLTFGLSTKDRFSESQEAEDPNDPQTLAITAAHEKLGALLMVSRNEMKRMARRYPPVLDMPASQVAERLMDVRDALPGCDACLLVEQYPQWFLSGDRSAKRAQIQSAADKLRAALHGADIASVIMWDAEVLFMDLDYGLKELRELWDVDEKAMAASEPRHLSTAVRALCNTKANPDPQFLKGV